MNLDDIDIDDLSKYSKIENESYLKLKEDVDGFSKLHIDALAELGNIGVGAASQAFSKFLNRDVSMSLPRMKILSNYENTQLGFFNEVHYEKAEIAIIRMSIVMPDRFELLCLIDKESVDKLLKILFANFVPRDNMSDYSHVHQSLIKEVGSILILRYVSSLNKLLDEEYVVSYPSLHTGPLLQAISDAQDEVNKLFGDFMFTSTKLGINLDIFTTEDDILFDLTILPSNDSVDRFLKNMGVA